ncbi:MAG: glycosyltransferase family 4 protein [Actinomycetota bacterium]
MVGAVLVSSSFLPGRGGIESYLGELCDELAPRLAVVAAAERDGRALPHDLPYPVYPFDGRLLWPGRAALQAVVAAARAEGTDKVVFGTPWPLVLMGPRLRSHGLRYSVIVHGAEMLVPSAIPVVRRGLAAALAGADLLLPVSLYTADMLNAFLARRAGKVPPMELLRARVDLQRFSPEVDDAPARRAYGIGPSERVVLCFGRLVPRKGVDRLIDALPAIVRRAGSTTVVIAGTGPEEKKLRRGAARTEGVAVSSGPDTGSGPETGVALPQEPGAAEGRSRTAPPGGGRVVFTGRVPEDLTPAVYAMADVFALPVVDRWFGLEIEGLGVVLLEAAATGVPCVTGRSGGTPEAVIDGVTGYVVDAGEPSALAGRIAHLLEHPEQARSMGLAGRTHVQENFSERAVPAALVEWLS